MVVEFVVVVVVDRPPRCGTLLSFVSFNVVCISVVKLASHVEIFEIEPEPVMKIAPSKKNARPKNGVEPRDAAHDRVDRKYYPQQDGRFTVGCGSSPHRGLADAPG